MKKRSPYSKYLLVLLALIMLIPCTLKREWKANLGLENTTQLREKTKLACATTNTQDNNPFNAQIHLLFLPKQSSFTGITNLSLSTYSAALPDYFIYFQQKIPAWLAYQSFLI